MILHCSSPLLLLFNTCSCTRALRSIHSCHTWRANQYDHKRLISVSSHAQGFGKLLVGVGEENETFHGETPLGKLKGILLLA